VQKYTAFEFNFTTTAEAMNVLDITDFYVGQSVTFTHRITDHDVARFVDLTGDDNPMHVDSEFTKETQVKYPVAHGMLTASFISTVIGKHLPGPGALWVSQKLEFLAPVRVSDQIDIFTEIKKTHIGNRLITLSISIKNQLNRPVIRGEAVVRWPASGNNIKGSVAEIPSQTVALVTGASRGIGAEIASQLGAKGHFVYVNYNNSESRALEVLGKIIKAGGSGEIIKGDVFNSESIKRIFSEITLKHNRLDILVNNASPSIREADALELDWDSLKGQFMPHIKSIFIAIKEAVPLFEKSGGGCVVNLGSVVVDDPPDKWFGYNLGKGCVHLLTRNLVNILGRKGVRINTVAPGFTETDLTLDIPERQLMMLKMKTPLGKLAEPEEIAKTVVFLTDDASSHVTGQVLKVNGGVS